jgi:hypothetical protein
MSPLVSRESATNRFGLPYNANASHTGKRKRSIISKPEMAGWISGMTNTKPSVVDSDSLWMAMRPSILTRVDRSMSGFDCGYMAYAEKASVIVAIGFVLLVIRFDS